MTAGWACILLASRLCASANRSRNLRVTAWRTRLHIAVARCFRGHPKQRQRAAWLHFERQRPGGGRGFRRGRSAHEWTIEPRRQPERAVAWVDPFGGIDPDPGSFKTHRALWSRLPGKSKSKRHAPRVCETTLLDVGSGKSARQLRNAGEQSWRY